MKTLPRFAAWMLIGVALNACSGSLYYTSDPIEAWVVDAETGKPIEGAVVTANWQLVRPTLDTGGSPYGQLEVMETITDNQGRFFFPGFTKLNFSLAELRNHDPQLLIFKAGYKYLGGGNNYPVGETPGAHRSSPANGKKLRLERAEPDARRYAQGLGSLTAALISIWESGNAGQVPRMLHALACERNKLSAIDPGTPLSIPGTAGMEMNCEAE